VTEDEDLLVLNGNRELGKVKILTASDFLKRIGHL
jgi:predicted nucleic acid-binding protein